MLRTLRLKLKKPIVCDSRKSEVDCKNPDCNGWFSHSQQGLAGGDYPPEYTVDSIMLRRKVK